MFFLVVSKDNFFFCTTIENVPFMYFGHGGPQNMLKNMVFLMHYCCMWPTTHAGCPVTHQNVSRVLGIAPKIFARKVTLKTIVHWQTDWGEGTTLYMVIHLGRNLGDS